MTWWPGARLVAARELLERSRTRSFRIVTALLVLIGIGGVVIPSIVGGSDEPTELAIVGPAPPGLRDALAGAARAVGFELRVERRPDRATAARAVRGGDLDAALVGAAGEGRATVLVDDELDPELRAAVSEALAVTRLKAGLVEAGVAPERADRLLAGAPLAVRPLDPDAGDEPTGAEIGLGVSAAVLLYVALLLTGIQVASAVAEDKTGRIVEVLLASLRPGQILFGKVIGIGLLGLGQLLALGVPLLVGALAFGSLDLPEATGTLVAATIAWFVVGFALYSAAFGALGALVARQEEVGQAISPLSMMLLAGYLLTVVGGGDQFDSPIVRVLTILPPFAPMTMPMRIAIGSAEPWEIVVSLALAIGSAAVLMVLGGRVYRRGIVRSGPKMKLRAALRRG
ncbi:MAG: type transport system permease protein [Miltoncostaeaceae bacterium]|jgi:ABC-2 type transport system permease protein|nr:type transport system permease protein [Miltoncostaeaceae bacterium]